VRQLVVKQRMTVVTDEAEVAAMWSRWVVVLAGSSRNERVRNEKEVRQLVTDRGMTMVTDEAEVAALVEQVGSGNGRVVKE